MSPSRFSYASGDGLDIAGYRWDPAGEPVAAVQLTHGMGEHVLRYDELARALTSRGMVVYGQDHRGHGATARPDALGDLGPGGWPALVDDIGRLTARIQAEHPGLPLILLAHSMGSFAAQQYLLDHSAQVDGVVLTGTATIDLLEPALDLDQPLDLAVFNAAFQPARTDFDWLTRDEAIVDAYVADPLCGFGIDPELGAGDVRRSAARWPTRTRWRRCALACRSTSAAGGSDPVNGGLTLLDPAGRALPGRGPDRHHRARLSGARHEIFNETNRAEVIADLISWLDRVLA